ncbi:MAG: replication factor C large subunit [Candidatus Aenigmarchaeota archaeon]|nr:replication factor C large subunit [Candidatus Aenigmarchaeota archaeon]
MDLWTEKHKPKNTKEILSQGSAITEMTNWIETWKPGKALFLHGPPGTGKTLIPEVIANERKWMLLQVNASEKRNSEAIENSLSESSKNLSLFHSGKLILIDEVDGISSGDRGGIGAIVKIIKESKFPIIVTANNPYISKLRPLRVHAKLVRLSKVNVKSIEKRLKEICEKEGVKADESVIKNLARWSSGDIRSAITDLQMLCEGKEEISEKDLESLGFRERETNIFSILPTIFRSKNINAAKKAIRNCDKDPDEIFWWVENNLHQEFTGPGSLAKAYDILSKADVFRQRVLEQQNWRFKLYMIDTLAGISLAGESSKSFIQYKPPDRFLMLSRLKRKRAEMSSVFAKLVPYTHSSEKIIKNYYLPYLKIILSRMKKEDQEGMEFTEEETKLIVSG